MALIPVLYAALLLLHVLDQAEIADLGRFKNRTHVLIHQIGIQGHRHIL